MTIWKVTKQKNYQILNIDFLNNFPMNCASKAQWKAPEITILKVEPEGAIGSGADLNQEGIPTQRGS